MRALAAVLLAFAAAGCTSSAPYRLPASSLAVRAGTEQDPPAPSRARGVVEFVTAQVGRRYCWGGTGPACFDCSGLVQQAWGSVGVRLPRTTGAIASVLSEVPLDDLREGDILWWPGHVGIYAGGGWMVDALDSRHGVVRRPAADPHRAFRPLY